MWYVGCGTGELHGCFLCMLEVIGGVEGVNTTALDYTDATGGPAVYLHVYGEN